MLRFGGKMRSTISERDSLGGLVLVVRIQLASVGSDLRDCRFGRKGWVWNKNGLCDSAVDRVCWGAEWRGTDIHEVESRNGRVPGHEGQNVWRQFWIAKVRIRGTESDSLVRAKCKVLQKRKHRSRLLP